MIRLELLRNLLTCVSAHNLQHRADFQYLDRVYALDGNEFPVGHPFQQGEFVLPAVHQVSVICVMGLPDWPTRNIMDRSSR